MAFRKLGQVALILNSKFVVIKSSEPLILGSEVIVYNEVKLNSEQEQSSGIKEPSIPKGKLKVVMLQEDKTYLATVITQRNSNDNAENQSLARSLTLYHAIFGKEDSELNSDDGKLASYSAVLDTKQAVNAKISHLVQVGDAVTFVQPVKIEADQSVKVNEQRLEGQPNN